MKEGGFDEEKTLIVYEIMHMEKVVARISTTGKAKVELFQRRLKEL